MTFRILLSMFAALLLAGCATGPGYYAADGRYADSRYSARCHDCGVVERIESIYGPGRATGGGAVLGGVVGGVLGSQVGSGSGRDAATIAGAAAGAVAGHNIEKNRASGGYEVYVRMDDGRRVVVTQRDLHGVRPGARVRIAGGAARLY
jgi:outer membrane lipoprotein SlyB